jgi:hypothetical protein
MGPLGSGSAAMAWNAGFARRLRSAGSVSSNLNNVPAARLGILRTLLGAPVVPGGHGARDAYRRNHPSAPPERHGAEYPGSWSPSLTHLKFGLAKPEVLKRLTAITVALRSDRSWRVNVDGELATKTPAKFEVRPKALTVMVPSALPLNHLDLSRPS